MSEASSPILRAIRRMVEDQRLAGVSDQELLGRFLHQHDETAFHALLLRYGPMVLDVCRAVVPNEADAEDAFQATFLVLTRNASNIRKVTSLASFLHGVARRTALKAKAEFARRQKHEARVPQRQPDEPDDLTWREVQEVLHEELGRLAERYRTPLVLCYLQGKTQDDAAALLGLAKGTLKGRLERGRALLRARLVRRNLGPAAMLVASAWPAALEPALVPRTLLTSTLEASSLTAAGQAVAGVISPRVVCLVEAVIRATVLSRVKTAVVVGWVIAALGVGGTLVWRSQAAENGPVTQQAQRTETPETKQDDIASVVRRVVATLDAHPIHRPVNEDHLGLFLMDLHGRDVRLIATQGDPNRTYCGTPCWSKDGRRILFDASPGKKWNETHLQMLEVTDQGPKLRSLGPGNCPTISPDGKHIAYLVNPGAASGEKPGIHITRTDGSDRWWLGGYGIPKWSPDGRHLLTVSFSNPCELALMDAATGESRPVRFPDHRIWSVPSWTSAGTLVAVVSSKQGTAIALVDVTNPDEATLEQALWRKGDGLDVAPAYPVYSPSMGCYVFAGREQKGTALYAFEPGKTPRPLEPHRYDGKIASLGLSPDGRYLLFCSDRR